MGSAWSRPRSPTTSRTASRSTGTRRPPNEADGSPGLPRTPSCPGSTAPTASGRDGQERDGPGFDQRPGACQPAAIRAVLRAALVLHQDATATHERKPTCSCGSVRRSRRPPSGLRQPRPHLAAARQQAAHAGHGHRWAAAARYARSAPNPSGSCRTGGAPDLWPQPRGRGERREQQPWFPTDTSVGSEVGAVRADRIGLSAPGGVSELRARLAG
jgi:hypothetical protein